jgi:small subunit ribosomal protein S11
MGKKKVGEQSESEVLKEASKVEATLSKASGKKVLKKANKGRAYIKSTYNNTTVTITDEKGNVLFWSTSGSLGFNGPKKATPFAASKIISVLYEKMKKAGMNDLDVIVSGVGGGRDSAIRSLVAHGVNISSIKDVTPIPHNGPKPKKVRRV